jgi:hypothetical protein
MPQGGAGCRRCLPLLSTQHTKGLANFSEPWQLMLVYNLAHLIDTTAPRPPP